MTHALRWVWRELTRSRGSVKNRFYRVGRSSRAGVALLMAITSITLLSIIVSESVHDAAVRAQLATHHRDEKKAEILAYSGVNLYRLVLIASKQIGNSPMISMASQYVGINADTIWQMIPSVNTTLMRLIFASGGDLERSDTRQFANKGLSEKDRAASREEGDTQFKRNFLDFDGDFSASVVDENRRVYVGSFKATNLTELAEQPGAIQLSGMMMGEVHDEFFRDLDWERLELIANLADWTDADNTRLYRGGMEDSLYENLDDPYKPKNAPFDSGEEIRLVDGWHDDRVWNRYGRHLTIYGEGKINVNTAERRVIKALISAYLDPYPGEPVVDDLTKFVMDYRNMPAYLGGGLFKDPQQFISFIENQYGFTFKRTIKTALSTQSNVFRVTSKGTVRDSNVQVEAVFDFSKKPIGKVLYWRVR
jgi:general secretion pathway protein K